MNADIEPQAKAIFRDYFVPVLIPLLVSAFAVSGVFTNIASQREKDEDTRQRKLLAARAKLPIALSNAHKAFEAGFRHSVDFDLHVAATSLEAFRDKSIPEMTLPDDAINTFLEVIEHHDNPDVAKRLSGILKEYQIFMSRWVDEFDTGAAKMLGLPGEVKRRTVSWAYLDVIVESLFNYAREGKAPEDVSQERLRGYMNFRLPDGHPVESYEDAIGLYARTFTRRFT